MATLPIWIEGAGWIFPENVERPAEGAPEPQGIPPQVEGVPRIYLNGQWLCLMAPQSVAEYVQLRQVVAQRQQGQQQQGPVQQQQQQPGDPMSAMMGNMSGMTGLAMMNPNAMEQMSKMLPMMLMMQLLGQIIPGILPQPPPPPKRELDVQGLQKIAETVRNQAIEGLMAWKKMRGS